MQLLFIQSAIHKLDENGRAAIIENGSPLFTGGTSSGESQIRRWLLERDYLETIVALPTDLFYNTGIATYIWILAKNKTANRRGKVQLIDATKFCHPLRKSLGNKRNEITPEDRAAVLKLYTDFAENEHSQIHANEEFIYREYTVMQPMQRSYGITSERIDRMISVGALNALYDAAKVSELEAAEELSAKDAKKLRTYQENFGLYTNIVERLRAKCSEALFMEPKPFLCELARTLADFDLDKKTVEKIADGLSQMDKRATVQKDKKGNVLYDKETKDSEIVPLPVAIEDYMAKEVLPHVPDAHWELDPKKVTTGAEIPFTRFFYKYEKPRESAAVLKEVMALQNEIAADFKELAK